MLGLPGRVHSSLVLKKRVHAVTRVKICLIILGYRDKSLKGTGSVYIIHVARATSALSWQSSFHITWQSSWGILFSVGVSFWLSTVSSFRAHDAINLTTVPFSRLMCRRTDVTILRLELRVRVHDHECTDLRASHKHTTLPLFSRGRIRLGFVTLRFVSWF